MVSKGNCYLCGAEKGKAAIKNHILKQHNVEGGKQECRLLKIEGAYDKDYWLFVDIPLKATLGDLDDFLRAIWLECCGHMSLFNGADESDPISAFPPGAKLLHEYDMGSTTETLITFVGTTWRKPQKNPVRLLARNVPPEIFCSKCGAPADYIDTEYTWSGECLYYCEACSEDMDEEMLLPVTNSPRMGVCGYCGELDVYKFVPPDKKG